MIISRKIEYSYPYEHLNVRIKNLEKWAFYLLIILYISVFYLNIEIRSYGKSTNIQIDFDPNSIKTQERDVSRQYFGISLLN